MISPPKLSFSLLFLLIASLLVLPTRSQVIVDAYDWINVGAFARYTNLLGPDGLLFPDGTKVMFYGQRLSSPAVLEWTIVGRTDIMVRLNVTFCINSTRVYHHVSFLLDVDMCTRDSFLDGEPIGKTCFWAVPFAEPGEEIVLYNLPPEQIVGYVKNVITHDVNDEEVKVYMVTGIQHDPYYWINPYARFVWYTGMADGISFIGCYSVPPGAHHSFNWPNGTKWIITRYANTTIAEKLCLYGARYSLSLTDTNVRLGPKPEDDSTGGTTDFSAYYPFLFVAALVVSTGAFFLAGRRKQRNPPHPPSTHN